MKSLSQLLYRFANLRTSVACLLLLMVYAFIVVRPTAAYFSSNPADYNTMPDLKFAYSYNYLVGFLQNSPEASLQSFAGFLGVWDNVFALVYGFTYLVWLSFLLKANYKAPLYAGAFNLYPIVLVLLDWLENFFELRILNNWQHHLLVDPQLAVVASGVTVLKWCGSALNGLIFAWLVVQLARKRFAKP